jgi:hypothetical protein
VSTGKLPEFCIGYDTKGLAQEKMDVHIFENNPKLAYFGVAANPFIFASTAPITAPPMEKR